VRLDESSAFWGFIDRTGKLVIRPQFGMPLWFSEGVVEGYGEENGILNVPLGYVDKSDRDIIRLYERDIGLSSWSDSRTGWSECRCNRSPLTAAWGRAVRG
jgi:hypothetical protein